MAVTALAGPVSNLLIGAVFLLLYGVLYAVLRGAVGEFFLRLVYTTAYLSVALAVFNLIPIPPLDGSKVLFSLLSDKNYYSLMRYEKYGMILLLVIVATGVLSDPLYAVTNRVFDFLFQLARFSNQIAATLM